MKQYLSILIIMNEHESFSTNCQTMQYEKEDLNVAMVIDKYNKLGYTVCGLSGDKSGAVLVMSKEI